MQRSLVAYTLERYRDGTLYDYLSWRLRYRGRLDIFVRLMSRWTPVRDMMREMFRLAYGLRQPSFKIIQIETIAGCNYSCSFCPIGKIEMPMGRMKMETYKNILAGLKDFRGKIHLYLRNEPLLDKRILEMTRMAKTQTKAEVLVSTNGALLKEEMARALTQYATVVVNDYGNVVAETIKSWGRIPKLILIPRGTDEVLENRAGNLPDRDMRKLQAFCNRPFEQMYIAFNGQAVLCCQDWKLETSLGSAATDNVQAIWRNPAYRAVRESLRRGERSGLCAKCDYAGL